LSKAAGTGGIVNSRTGKSDVNPLTRPFSRSVMALNYSVAAVEGAAATTNSLPGRIIGQPAHPPALQWWIIGLAP
jgi:hypothetical protein